MMKCEKVRPFLPSVAGGSLDGREAHAVAEHLAGCSACRKQLESTQKLRGLLALKRYEKPDEFFHRSFLSEFHRRVLSGMVRKPSVWARLREACSWGAESGGLLVRLSYGAAFAVVLLSLYTAHILMESGAPQHFAQRASVGTPGNSDSSVVEIGSSLNHLILADNRSDQASVYVMDRVDYEPTSQRSVVLEF